MRRDFNRQRMADRAQMKKVNETVFGDGMKCYQSEDVKCCRCKEPISIGQSRASLEDHHFVLCQPCVDVGISLGKLEDPMKDNPLKDW